MGSPVPVTAGAATLPHSFNAAGSFAVTAEFTGAAGFTSSSAQAQNVTVSDPDVTTSLSVTVPASATTGESGELVGSGNTGDRSGFCAFKVNGSRWGLRLR
ncbi:hypothetical protein GTA09_30895 [Rhodococcus hoagii]|nr:hypothetical protein [Prescottella equi]